MPKYVIESPHESEECLQALDEILEKGEDTLGKFVFGCKSGEHQAWAYVEAETPEKALEIVPESIRDEACIHEVGKFSAEDIKDFHKS